MPEPHPNYVKPLTARYTVRVVTSASLSTRLMAKVAGRTLTAHARRISAENRLNTVKAQRDELAEHLDELLALPRLSQMVADTDADTLDALGHHVRLLARIRVAQAAENGPDNV